MLGSSDFVPKIWLFNVALFFLAWIFVVSPQRSSLLSSMGHRKIFSVLFWCWKVTELSHIQVHFKAEFHRISPNDPVVILYVISGQNITQPRKWKLIFQGQSSLLNHSWKIKILNPNANYVAQVTKSTISFYKNAWIDLTFAQHTAILPFCDIESMTSYRKLKRKQKYCSIFLNRMTTASMIRHIFDMIKF